MGASRWNSHDWDIYVSSTAGLTVREIFSRGSIHPKLDPLQIRMRESCDSDINPNSTPIIVAVDETGSMGILAENLIRRGLGVLIEEIYNRKPVPDPHVMCMAFGDAWFDRAPLQVTQFEADICLVSQVADFWIEGNGGGNNFESYNLPWYFAATRTRCDSFLKRGKKGYLFTVGDEPPAPRLLAKHAKSIFGDSTERDIDTKEILQMVSQSWDVFHIMIEEGNYFRGHADQTKKAWNDLLGQKAIPLSDHS